MKRFRESEHGMAAVEVALLLPALAMILFLLVEGANTLHDYSTISEASRSAARQVVLSGDTSTAKSTVESLVTELPADALNTKVTLEDAGTAVTVEVSYAYQSFFSSTTEADAPLSTLYTLTARTTMPIP